MNYSDAEIIQSIHKGKEHEILKYLYKKVLPGVKAYVCSNSGTADDAFDIFQDAMVAFYRYVKENRFKSGYNVEIFIFCICKNAWINKAKRNKKIVSMDNTYDYYKDDAENALDGIISAERAAIVQDVLSRLGTKCEELLKYSIFEDMSMREISEKMGFTSEDAVKTRKYKCKQKLLELIQNYYFIEQ